ncbi:MAG: histidine--tRNA ligase [Bacteroidota bacterium]
MKVGTPKGTRDFSPEQVNKRNFIFNTIRSVFVKYGFQPIETPTMEDLTTLMGKYGDEGDQLLFKVLNNGDFLSKANEEALGQKDSKKILTSISKRGLRYDLTVPFARYVVQHQNDIVFPFKRYQIQPVWRADRPQKGRYQEFYQCDVDVIGSKSLVYEAELLQIYDEVFSILKVPTIIKMNNRKILAGIADAAGIADQFMTMTIAIDKLDKIGLEGVQGELRKREIPEESIETISQILQITSLEALKPLFVNSEIGLKGIEELESVFAYLSNYTPVNTISFDITLARGLNYYTGCIFEVKAKEVKMGSIGGGGRYDDLTGVFGLKDMSGVGISFGAERIYDVMEELNLFPEDKANQLQLLFIAFDEAAHQYAYNCLIKIRAAAINSEIYPEPVKMKKQMKYANARGVKYVVIIGSDEMSSGQLSFKDMESGEQQKLTLDEIINKLSA